MLILVTAFLIVVASLVPALCWLALFAFVPVLWGLREKAWKTWAKNGAALFFIVSLGAYYWVYYVGHYFGGLSMNLSILAVPVFAFMNIWQGLAGFALFGWFTSIAHKPSTAAADKPAAAASRSKKVLNVASATPPRFFLRAPCIHRLLHRLATMACEQWRLDRVRVKKSLLFALCMSVAWHTIPAIFFWDYSLLVRSWLPLIQSLDIFGGFGLDFFLFWFNYEIFAAMVEQRYSKSILGFLKTATFPLVVLLILNIYGFNSIALISRNMDAVRKVKILLIQPNINSGEKGKPEFTSRSLMHLVRMTDEALAKSRPDLIVWPETLFPLNYRHDKELQVFLEGKVRDWKAPLFFGSNDGARVNNVLKSFNSGFFISPNEHGYQNYSKHILLAFGEYIPFESTFPVVREWFPPRIGNFGRGAGPTIINGANFKFSPLICYESTKGDYVRKNATLDTNFAVEITNDGWYFQSSALLYHNNLAALRTVENRLGIARNTNTGITVYIDPMGQEWGRLPLEKAQYSFVSVPLYREKTIYARWGYMLYYAAISVLAALVIMGFRKARE